jgi:DNA replication and repair protein RecF
VILEERLRYTDKLKEIAKEIYAGLSGSSEKMSLSYKRKLPEEMPLDAAPKALLKHARRDDILNGSTNYGIHRDDIVIEIDGKSAREFGSQGQQRSCALALKLAEARIVREFTKEQPIALLDDVMSELDPGRQDYILNHIDGWQVFITCCDPSAKLRMFHGCTFEISRGTVLDIKK